MKIIKPKRLHHGDVIGLCAPASPPTSEHNLNNGIRYLEQLGFRIELGKNIHKRNGYLAGSDLQRAVDINDLFANPKVKAVFTIRGGYGSHRILPLLDYNVIKHNPKILVGYSDITALHFALLSNCSLVTFSGPMIASEMSRKMDQAVEEQFWRCLTSTKPPKPFCGDINKLPIFTRSGNASGLLLGGNFLLVSSLVGTPYFPSLKNQILILEEIDERPYRIDRMLQQMKLAGIFRKTNGIALGDFNSCKPEKGKPSLTLNEIFKSTFKDFSFPVVSGLPYGHVRKSYSFPLGVRVNLNGKKNCIEFLEAGVSE